MRLLLPCLLVLVVVTGALPAGAEEGEPDRYIRLREDGERLRLDIAARELVPTVGEGPRVWLVGVVHVGDLAYYEALQAFLDDLDLVLYESVLPPGAGRLRTSSAEVRIADTRTRLAFLAAVLQRVRRDGEAAPADPVAVAAAASRLDPRLGDFVAGAWTDAWGGRIVLGPADEVGAQTLTSLGADGRPGGAGEAADLSAGPAEGAAFELGGAASAYNLQKELGVALGLAWQGDGIDYDRAHFVPSDMARDALVRAIEARGGDAAFVDKALAGAGFSGMAARLVIGALKLGGTFSGGRLTAVLKALMVSLLSHPAVEEGRLEGVDAATMGAILYDRNAVVMGDLDAWIAALADASPPARIGAFYGAAHMRDLERRLRERGYAAGRTRWFCAIEVDLAATGLSRARLDALRARVERSLGARSR